MSARESSIVTAILAKARTFHGLAIRKRHGTIFGVTGDPDLYGAFGGKHFECEVKRPGEVPTPLQIKRLAEWRAAGAFAFWVDNEDDFFERLTSWRGRW